MLKVKVKIFAGSLKFIDDSAFILMGSLLKILAPKNANVFLPASDFTFGSNEL